MMAMHVYCDVSHHPLHVEWVMGARKRLSPAVKQELATFSAFVGRPIASFWNDSSGSHDLTDFEETMKQFKRQPVKAYVIEAIRTLTGGVVTTDDGMGDAATKTKWIDIVRQRHPSHIQLAEELLYNPERSKQRFIEMVEAFWKECVETDWPLIEAELQEEIKLRGNWIRQAGPIGALTGITPEIRVDESSQTAVIRRLSSADIHFEPEDNLVLIPSYFAWPHVFVQAHRPVTIVYPCSQSQLAGRQPVLPEALLSWLQAAADPTRLQIIQVLGKKPRSTKEIAALLGLTEAAISKHLKQLQAADMIQAKRNSYYVFYHLVNDPFRALIDGLGNFLPE